VLFAVHVERFALAAHVLVDDVRLVVAGGDVQIAATAAADFRFVGEVGEDDRPVDRVPFRFGPQTAIR
jgi:hypothetical protein